MKKFLLLVVAAIGVGAFVRAKMNSSPAVPTQPAPQPWRTEPVQPVATQAAPDAVVVPLNPEPVAKAPVETVVEEVPEVVVEAPLEAAPVEAAPVEDLVAEVAPVEEMIAVAEPPLVSEFAEAEAQTGAVEAEADAEVLTAADFASEITPAGPRKNRRGHRPAGSPTPPPAN